MAISNHVPGPYYVDGAKPHQIVLHTEKTNLIRVASVNTQFTGTYLANARLLAAAPEMYDALLVAAARLETAGITDGPSVSMIKNAIAKAEGAQ